MKSLWTVLALVLVGLAGCTDGDGSASDRDDDGLSNLEEEQGWQIVIEPMGMRIARHVTSDPDLRDTDGDGVDDVYEYALRLDPRSKDTDGDGLTDCQEVFHTVVADCEDPGFDGEGDGGYGTFAHRADSDPRVSRYWQSEPWVDETDSGEPLLGDGISDYDEIFGYPIALSGNRTRVVTSDPLKVDSDGDLLEDGEEALLYRSDPGTFDTDGDGCQDGLDPVPDRHEAILVDLEELVWDEPGRSGSIDVVVLAVIAEEQRQYPSDDGLIRLAHGVPKTLDGEEFGPLRPSDCRFTPFHPWQVLSIQIWRPDPGHEIDVSESTVPNLTGQVWFNPQDGRFHWNARSPESAAAEEAFDEEDGLLKWSGADGSISFSVETVDLE